MSGLGQKWGSLAHSARLLPQLIGEEEDVSVYDIADHPDFRFRTTDIVIRIGNTEDGALPKEDEVGVMRSLQLLSVRWLQSLTLPPDATRSRDLKVFEFCIPGWLAWPALETGNPYTWRLQAVWTLAVRFPRGLHSTAAENTTQSTAAEPRQA